MSCDICRNQETLTFGGGGEERKDTKICYSVINMLLLRNFLYNHSSVHILYEVLHWGLLKISTNRLKFKIPVEL